MKVGIVGMGFVGGTTAKVLQIIHEIIPYDRYKKPYTDPSPLKNAEVVFICVPTPMRPGGEMDYSAIHHSMQTLQTVTEQLAERPLVVVRSTAVSGTTDALERQYPFHVAFNPEFLREKSALEDMLKTDKIVTGAEREEDFKKVEAIYKPIFPNAIYVKTNRKTAEMIKYANNAFLAGSISLANEIFQICKALDIDFETVKHVLLLDTRNPRNIDVPGHDGDFGFGGKCLPKDLNALIYLAREHMYRPYILEEIWRLNERVRKDKDWLNIPGATTENQDFER